MKTFVEEEAKFYRPGGTTYVKLNPTFVKFLDLKVDKKTDRIITKAKICLAVGKHGPFVYIFNEKQQKEYQKEKQKEGGE